LLDIIVNKTDITNKELEATELLFYLYSYL